jgi:hypothetical protein
MQKNKSIKNKWLFINDFKEILGKNSNGSHEKIIKIYNGFHISEYNGHILSIKFNAEVKYNGELKVKELFVKITDTEIRNEKTNEKHDFKKNPLFTIFKAFKSFMSELKSLVSDLDFLNDI